MPTKQKKESTEQKKRIISKGQKGTLHNLQSSTEEQQQYPKRSPSIQAINVLLYF
jgi:hypothetical protein